MSYRTAAALLFVFRFCLAAETSRTAGFPWVDSAGISQPVLLCADEPSATVRQQFEKLAGGASGRIVVLGREDIHQDPPSQLANVIVRSGDLTDSSRRDLIGAMVDRPDHVGILVTPRAALAIHDRRMKCLGEGNVTLLLAASAGRPLLEIELKPGMQHDLIMLRRGAIERAMASFPPVVPAAPHVSSGALLIHGGGEMPLDVTEKFLELAGGPDAPIVVLPIAAEGTLPEDESQDTRVWTRVGATNVRSLRARTREEVESPEFADAVQSATAVWFKGGRQWRFVDAYMGTKAEGLLRGVLDRGGVIGGSSAGASIQSQYMPRGSPLENTDMMAEGYERGLGFLPGTAVDQHFTERMRHADMTALMQRHPQLLGIGLDEGTAIVVQGSTAQVIGRGGVHFYDSRSGPPGGDQDFTLVRAGGRYDLARRRATGGGRTEE